MDKDIFLVMGGFHLVNHTDDQVNTIIREMQMMNVIHCGPSHCTGDRAIELFESSFGSGFYRLGTGRVIVVPDEVL